MAVTPVELFRAGNATSARLDRVRLGPAARDDLPTRLVNGVDSVDPNTGGASAYTFMHPNVSGPWHRLPAGTTYDDTRLYLWSDQPDHWLFEPAQIMSVADYLAALADVNGNFVPV